MPKRSIRPAVRGAHHPSRMRRWYAAVCIVCVAATACEPRESVTVTTTPNGSRLALPHNVEPVAFRAGTVQIHDGSGVHTLRAEFAEDAQQRERGLMYRTAMPEDASMLFIYPGVQEGGFWMYNTHMPLSIAYADTAGVVFQISRMDPCPSPYASLCPTYPAQQPFRYALEVNEGYFARRGIQPGARITYSID